MHRTEGEMCAPPLQTFHKKEQQKTHRLYDGHKIQIKNQSRGKRKLLDAEKESVYSNIFVL